MSDAGAELRTYLAQRSPALVERYVARLRADRNGLLTLGREAVEASARAMLHPVTSGEPESDTEAAKIAIARASALVSPAESIKAAGHLYRLAAEVVTEGAAELGTPAEVQGRLHEDLHTAVFSRIQRASLPYAHHLLAQISGAHLDERKRIARELHDRAAHAVATAQFEAELRAEDLADEAPDAAAHFTAIIESLREASVVIHEISQELGRSSAVEQMVSALDQYAAVRGEGRVTMYVRGREHVDAIPGWAQDELYIVVREGMLNALRHSGSDRIVVTLDGAPERFRATVSDDGPGIPREVLDGVLSSGRGLGALRDRVRLLSGTIELDTRREHGTTLSVTVPLTP